MPDAVVIVDTRFGQGKGMIGSVKRRSDVCSAKSVSVGKRPVPAGARRPRDRALWVAIVAAVLAHALGLSGMGWVWPRPDVAPASPMSMRVRAVDAERLPLAALAAAALAEGVPAVEAGPAAAPVRARPPVPRLPHARPPLVSNVVSPADAPLTAAEPPPSPATVPAGIEASSLADDAPPTYRTLIPPAINLRYRLARGAASGTGELAWQPQGRRYALRFEGRVGATGALEQVSEGGFDAAGVAPQRFVERRIRRAAAAVNFQRDVGRITFSGKAPDAPLPAGSQDRLSWMLQLAAIVAADPALRQGDARVLINVASAGGEVAVWAFRCTGAAVLEPATGTEGTLAFVREGRGLYDTRAQVWLDPARGYLPARATWRSGPTDEGFDLQLEASSSDAAGP